MIYRRKPGLGITTGEGQMKRVVLHERRQKARALHGRHQLIEYQARENGGVRQHHGNIGIALRQLFHQQARRQMVGACATGFF